MEEKYQLGNKRPYAPVVPAARLSKCPSLKTLSFHNQSLVLPLAQTPASSPWSRDLHGSTSWKTSHFCPQPRGSPAPPRAWPLKHSLSYDTLQSTSAFPENLSPTAREGKGLRLVSQLSPPTQQN